MTSATVLPFSSCLSLTSPRIASMSLLCRAIPRVRACWHMKLRRESLHHSLSLTSLRIAMSLLCRAIPGVRACWRMKLRRESLDILAQYPRRCFSSCGIEPNAEEKHGCSSLRMCSIKRNLSIFPESMAAPACSPSERCMGFSGFWKLRHGRVGPRGPDLSHCLFSL